MIKVKVNGVESRNYAGRVSLGEIVSDLYPKDNVLEYVKVDGQNVPISNFPKIYVSDNQVVDLGFMSLEQSITKIAQSAVEFLDWLDSQDMDKDHIFTTLSKIASGLEVIENAIFSIQSVGRKIETEQENRDVVTKLEEINSFTTLGKKEEVRKRIQELSGIYRKIFLRVLEGGFADGSVYTERNFNGKS